MMNNYTDEFLKCKECAFFYINKKRYTKKEVTDKLVKKGYEVLLAKEVVDYLEEAEYLDDADYARRYTLDAVRIKKYGIMRIKNELYFKGIDRQVVDDVIDGLNLDTFSSLLKLIESKASKLDLNDEKQLNKLYGFLLRRGFSYSQISDAVMEYRNMKENL